MTPEVKLIKKMMRKEFGAGANGTSVQQRRARNYIDSGDSITIVCHPSLIPRLQALLKANTRNCCVGMWTEVLSKGRGSGVAFIRDVDTGEWTQDDRTMLDFILIKPDSRGL